MPRKYPKSEEQAAPIKLYCRRVATRREHAIEKQRCEATENGTAGLAEDLWLRTLEHLDSKTIAWSCMGVCRKWQEWSYQATGQSFSLSLSVKCTKCGKLCGTSETMTKLTSLAQYLEKRGKTLEVVRLSCGHATRWPISRILDVLFTKCTKLRHLEMHIASQPQELLAMYMLSLPSTLKVLKINCPCPPHFGTLKFLNLEEADLQPSIHHPAQSLGVICTSPTLKKLTLRYLTNSFPASGSIDLRNLRVLTIQTMENLGTALVGFVLNIKQLEELHLKSVFNITTDLSQLKNHPSLQILHITGVSVCERGVFDCILVLPQLITLEVTHLATTDTDGVIAPDLSSSKLQRLTVGTPGPLQLDLLEILKAPKLEALDIWSSKADLQLPEDADADCISYRRPLKIAIDSEERFSDVDGRGLQDIGFEVIHSHPECECCGVELSVWYANYCTLAYASQHQHASDTEEWWEEIEPKQEIEDFVCQACS